MKRLIKRYVLQAQIDKESDEVNEGELKSACEHKPHLGPETELRESWRGGHGIPPGISTASCWGNRGYFSKRADAVG